MSDVFDPYREWLNITKPANQLLSHYDMLGLAALESDLVRITKAAQLQRSMVLPHVGKRHHHHAKRLLTEIREAAACLRNPRKKAAYDERLASSLQPSVEPQIPRSTSLPTPRRTTRAADGSQTAALAWVGFAFVGVVCFLLIAINGASSPSGKKPIAKSGLPSPRVAGHTRGNEPTHPSTAREERTPSAKDVVEEIAPPVEVATDRPRSDTSPFPIPVQKTLVNGIGPIPTVTPALTREMGGAVSRSKNSFPYPPRTLAPSAIADKDRTARDLYCLAQHLVWLEDYEGSRKAVVQFNRIANRNQRAFFSPYLEPLVAIISDKPEENAQVVELLRERTAVKLEPGRFDFAGPILLAAALTRTQQNDDAIAILEPLSILENPRFWVYRVERAHLLAILYARRGDWEKASSVIQEAVPLVSTVEQLTSGYDIPPAICDAFRIRIEQIRDMHLKHTDPAQWLYKQHAIAVMTGDRALKGQVKLHFDELLEKYPLNYWAGRAAFESGLRLCEEGRVTEAAQNWQRMVESQPEGPWRGHALLALGDYRLTVELAFDSALEYYRKALDTYTVIQKRDDANVETWQAVVSHVANRLAVMQMVSGERGSAARMFALADRERGGEFLPQVAPDEAWLAPTSKMMTGGAGKYVPVLEFQKAQFPCELLDGLARALRGPFITPDTLFEARHSSVALLVALADRAATQGNHAVALPLLERVMKGVRVESSPKHEQYAGRRLAEVLIAAGRFADADELLSKLSRARQREDRPQLLLVLGRLRSTSLNQPANAFKTLKELVGEHPQSPEVVEAKYLIAKCLLAEKQWDRATEAFREFRATHPQSPWSAEIDNTLLPLAENKGVRRLIDPLAPEAPKGGAAPNNPTVKSPPKFVPSE